MDVEFRISPAVAERSDRVVVRGFEVGELSGAADRVVVPSDSEVREALALRGTTLENLSVRPPISEWRSAVARCGLKPSRFKSSAEALARRWLSGAGVVTPLRIVDLYCAVSAMHLAPLAAYDLDRLPAPVIELRLADPANDTFEPLGGRPADMPLSDKVAVYASGSTVLCYAYNHRDSSVSCLTSATERAIFFGEALSETQDALLTVALDELRERLVAAGATAGSLRST